MSRIADVYEAPASLWASICAYAPPSERAEVQQWVAGECQNRSPGMQLGRRGGNKHGRGVSETGQQWRRICDSLHLLGNGFFLTPLSPLPRPAAVSRGALADLVFLLSSR